MTQGDNFPLWSLISKHANERPEAVACSKNDRVLTYGQLQSASLSLASLFISRGISGGHTVPVFVSRDLESVVSIIALLRIGACFVPIDGESWSQSRVDSVLCAVESKIVIVAQYTELNTNDIPTISLKDVQSMFDEKQNVEHDLLVNINHTQASEKPLYMIFTSGTTGTPKGVVISRASVENYVIQGTDHGMPFNLGVRESDQVLLLFSLAFDAAWGVFFSALCHGAHLVLSEPANVLEDAKKCTILPATPSLLVTLGDSAQYPKIKSVFLGGESPKQRILQEWWSEERSIYNCYGPTETTICASMASLRPDHPITLGEPMSNTQFLILDDQLKVCDDGELHISGPGLAIGFYKNEELTNERFFDWEGLRVFATRDRACRTSEGIVFCGRFDSIVKNRGYLINLETDVIPILESCTEVHSAAAFMHEGKLIGAVTPESVDVAELRNRLSQKHDAFVVPDQIFAHSEFCRTPNGKVDTKGLQSIFSSEAFKSSETRDLNSSCSKLQEAVAETLGIAAGAVAMKCSFWELGGNSLLAIKLASSLRRRGELFQFSDLLAPIPLSLLSTRVKSANAQDERHDTASTESTASTAPAVYAAPAALESQSPSPITTTQMGMIRSSIQQGAKSYMVVIIEMSLKDEIGYTDRVRSAWETIMQRHSIFSTYFDMTSGKQRIDDSYSHDWEHQSLPDIDMSAAAAAESDRLFESTRRQGSDLLYRPLNTFRMIVNQSATKATLLWLVHHTRVDGWSMGLVIQEVQDILQREPLSPGPFQFPQIARELPQHLALSISEGKQFWREAMSKVTEATPLILPNPPTRTETQFGETAVMINLGIGQFEQMCRNTGVSSASVIYTAWALLLKSYTAQDHVIFGTVFSGRHLPLQGIESVVGPLINSCPLPVCLTDLPKKSDLLKYVQELVLQIISHQWHATEALQETTRDTESQAFQTMLFLEYDLPSFKNQEYWSFARRDVPEFGLTTIIRRANDGLELNAIFDENLYTQPFMERMMNHFRNLILALLSPTCQTVAQIRQRMLEPCEALSLITASRDMTSPYSGPSNLKEAFEKGVDQWTNETAIESGTQKLTYRELDSKANLVAQAISAQVPPRTAVGIVSDRTLEWLVAVIGVIKAGAIYVPLDTKLPLERMQTMTKTASVQLWVFPNEACHARFGDAFNGKKILPWTLESGSQACIRSTLMPEPQDIAYITFTSGSTGAPKGVRIEHRSVVSYLSYGPARMDARPGRRHAQMFSPGFDVNQAEIFGTLCYGATLVLADPIDPFEHLQQVDATMITPSFLSVCEPDQFPNIDTILFAGEAVPQVLADIWAGSRTVYNSYGPCECTIGCLFKVLRPLEEVTLGFAIPRVGVYLLDSQNQPVPIGVPGEICLSGIQIADGYIGADRQDLSRTKFVPDPFAAGQRMYRTGDSAMWNEEMEPKFLGRFDNQVKVRGHRVELTEIENVIRLASPAIRRAAAIVHSDNIVAYVEPDAVDIGLINAALRTKLPRYACPSAIFALPSLPTMPNQKLDRKALVSKCQFTQGKASEPLTHTQSLVAEAWREAIGISEEVVINADSDFLELGGSSLSQIKLAQIVSRRLGSKVPLKIFIWNTELSALSQAIEQWSRSTDQSSQVPFSLTWPTTEPPFTSTSESEEEFVRLSTVFPPQTFNVGYKLALRGDLNIEQLERSVVSVTSHEAVLKSCFYLSGDRVLRGQSPSACELTRNIIEGQDLEAFTNRPFDLSTGPLTRINISSNSSGVDILILQHHAVTDKAGIQILLRKIQDDYLRRSIDTDTNKAPAARLPDYTIWAQWKAGQLRIDRDGPNALFWKDRLSNMPAQLFQSHAPTFVGQSTSFSWRTNGKFRGSTELCLALTAMTLAQCQKNREMVLGIPHVDRTEPGTEDMLGVFLNRLPVRLDVESTTLDSFPSLVDSTQISVREALAHAISFQNIREMAGLHDLFQVMIVYNQREDSVGRALSLPGVSVKEQSLKPTGAKFPLLVEFTETEEATTCELEFMENLVLPATAAQIREEMTKNVKLLGTWFGIP
ncbi:Pyridine nucleotide-disulfide oxidoreductase [Penicillium brevicompactum]